MSSRRPKRFFAVLSLVLRASGVFAGSFYLHIHPFYAYLMCVNLLTFIAYGFDKRQAVTHHLRVPEVVLHCLALFGGSPAALAAQIIFRHKTRKISFRAVFIGIICLQAAAAWLYWAQR
ncbi:MAG: DUF1294 domain-containing protein [Planctomycetota bacterium]